MSGSSKTKVAFRYAEALLRVVEAKNGVEGEPTAAQRIATELTMFVEIWSQHSDLTVYLLSPIYPKRQREAALAGVVEECKLSSPLPRLLRILLTRDRLTLLPELAKQFTELADKRAGVVEVEITSAREIEADEKTGIENRLRKVVSGRPRFYWKTKPEILGGLIITVGGQVLDGSIESRLKRMQHSFLGRLS